jgi:hypothetical protein
VEGSLAQQWQAAQEGEAGRAAQQAVSPSACAVVPCNTCVCLRPMAMWLACLVQRLRSSAVLHSHCILDRVNSTCACQHHLSSMQTVHEYFGVALIAPAAADGVLPSGPCCAGPPHAGHAHHSAAWGQHPLGCEGGGSRSTLAGGLLLAGGAGVPAEASGRQLCALQGQPGRRQAAAARGEAPCRQGRWQHPARWECWGCWGAGTTWCLSCGWWWHGRCKPWCGAGHTSLHSSISSHTLPRSGAAFCCISPGSTGHSRTRSPYQVGMKQSGM